MEKQDYQRSNNVSLKDRLLMGIIRIRQYPRNESHYGSVIVLGIGYALALGSILLYQYWYVIPEIVFLTMFMIALLAWMPVRHANAVKWGGLVNLLIGLFGIGFHIRLGLSAFDNHYEPLAFSLIALGGFASVARRLFNHWIWKQHDRLDGQYGKTWRSV